MSKEAMKLALEAMKADQKLIKAYRPRSHTERLLNAIKALEEALAKQEQGEPSYAERLLACVEDFAKHCGWSKESGEGAFECVQRTSYAQGVEDGKLQRKQEQGEPVGYTDEHGNAYQYGYTGSKFAPNIQLYTTPQQRKPLTDERVDYIYAQLVAGQLESIEEQEEDPIRIFAKAIEAAHGIKE